MIILFIYIVCAFSYSIKDKFCGDDNCFTILGLHKTAKLTEIKKSFRELSKVHHPDKVQNEDSTNYYRKIIQAYEVLSNEETRTAYEDYLSNPNRSELYYHYQYYKTVYHPQHNPYIVVSCAIFLLSLIQYVGRIGMYKNALNRVMETSHFKNVVNERIRNGGSREQVIKEALNEVNITGAWSYPKMVDIWIFGIIHFIYIQIYGIYFYFKWKWIYEGKERQIPLGDADYKTKCLLNIHWSKWEHLQNREELVDRQLWIKENWDEFQEEQKRLHEEYLQRHSGKVKMMKRFMKKNQ